MSRGVIILGSGGHAKVLVDTLQQCGITIVGLVDETETGTAATVLGAPFLGSEQLVFSRGTDTVELVNGVGSVRVPSARRAVYEKFKARGYRFATVVHPSAVVARDVVLGEGAQVLAGAVVQPGVVLGDNCLLNTRASVDHDCTIGAHTHVASGAVLSGGVAVAEEVHIGAAAVVRQYLRIGDRALVAAGAVVIDDVAPGTCVAGVPAKAIAR